MFGKIFGLPILGMLYSSAWWVVILMYKNEILSENGFDGYVGLLSLIGILWFIVSIFFLYRDLKDEI